VWFLHLHELVTGCHGEALVLSEKICKKILGFGEGSNHHHKPKAVPDARPRINRVGFFLGTRPSGLVTDS